MEATTVTVPTVLLVLPVLVVVCVLWEAIISPPIYRWFVRRIERRYFPPQHSGSCPTHDVD